MPADTLSTAIDDYHAQRKSVQVAKATRANEIGCLRRLLTVCGNIQVANINDRHVSAYLADAARTRSANSLALDYGIASRFFVWCAKTKRAPRSFDPMYGMRPPSKTESERSRVHVSQFPRLLDAARNPRDRVCIALGLYLFLRGSEVVDLRVGDIDFQAREIRTRVIKVKRVDVMPMSTELAAELTRWLTAYTETVNAPLDPTWFLVPARTGPQWASDGSGRAVLGPGGLVPTKQAGQPYIGVQNALVAIGFIPSTTNRNAQVSGRAGQGSKEGVHTLRRSGARALFDRLRGEGYDGSIRTVQSMLHHKSMVTTEHYLGLDLDRQKRNELIAGNLMFSTEPATNVVSLEHGRDRAASV